MNTRPKRQKMCWNCEGNVNLDEEKCPYCQAILFPQPSDDEPKEEYAPPYKVQNSLLSPVIPKSPFSPRTSQEPADTHQTDENDDSSPPHHTNDISQIVITMSLLMAGLVFFLFGWVLFAFSDKGYLVLRWSDAYWYIYLGLGVLMLFFGFRSLSSVDEDIEP